MEATENPSYVGACAKGGGINVDERLWEILDILGDGEVVTPDVIAERLGVTTRTVRTVLARTRHHLDNAGASIDAKPGVGYTLTIHDRGRFERFVTQRARRGLPRTSAERVRYLLELLLTARDYVKLDEIAEALFVSKKTLAQDMRRVEATLSEYSLLVDRRPYHGLRVVGSEFDIRHCLASSFQQLTDILNLGDVPLETIARDALRAQGMSVSDRSFRNLVVHLAVALKRVQTGNVLRGTTQDITSYVTQRELDVAQSLLLGVSRAAHVEFPVGELSYLALNLAGKRILGEGATAGKEFSDEARSAVHEMLDILDETYGFGLADDSDLAASLIQHVFPLLIRLRFGMHLTNPVLHQIKEGYPLAFVMASQAASVLTRGRELPVTDDELGYIAMWLALSLQRKRPKPRRKRVLLVCSSGMGSAKLLEFAFRERFPDLLESISTSQAHQLADVDFSEIDLVFTTLPLHHTLPVPVYEVHDFLDDSDLVEVRRALSRDRNANIAQYLSPELFLPHLSGRTRDEVIREMAAACHRVHDLPDLFMASVLRREELSSTDFGNLVAMPHAEVAMSPETFVCVGVLDEPIRWVRHEVQAVFLVSISTREGQDLRRFYGTFSRFLMGPESVADLIKKRDFDALVEALHNIEQKLEAS